MRDVAVSPEQQAAPPSLHGVVGDVTRHTQSILERAQMLSTLGGASMAESLVGEAPAPADKARDEPQTPVDEARGEAQSDAQDEKPGADQPKKGEEQQQNERATAQKQGAGARR
jgi:hypothetical protein